MYLLAFLIATLTESALPGRRFGVYFMVHLVFFWLLAFLELFGVVWFILGAFQLQEADNIQKMIAGLGIVALTSLCLYYLDKRG